MDGYPSRGAFLNVGNAPNMIKVVVRGKDVGDFLGGAPQVVQVFQHSTAADPPASVNDGNLFFQQQKCAGADKGQLVKIGDDFRRPCCDDFLSWSRISHISFSITAWANHQQGDLTLWQGVVIVNRPKPFLYAIIYRQLWDFNQVLTKYVKHFTNLNCMKIIHLIICLAIDGIYNTIYR